MNGRSNYVSSYSALTKLLIQPLSEYSYFFQKGRELFHPCPFTPTSTEDLSALIKSEFSQLHSAVNLSPLCLNRLKG